MTRTLANDNDLTSSRIRKNKIKQYQSLVDNNEDPEDFSQIRTLYIISNVIGVKSKSHPSKQYSSNESEANEDVELLLKDLMNKKDLEENK